MHNWGAQLLWKRRWCWKFNHTTSQVFLEFLSSLDQSDRSWWGLPGSQACSVVRITYPFPCLHTIYIIFLKGTLVKFFTSACCLSFVSNSASTLLEASRLLKWKKFLEAKMKVLGLEQQETTGNREADDHFYTLSTLFKSKDFIFLSWKSKVKVNRVYIC